MKASVGARWSLTIFLAFLMAYPAKAEKQEKGLIWPVDGQLMPRTKKAAGDTLSQRLLQGHVWLNIMAVEGADVKVVDDGVVTKTGEDSPLYRRFIIVRHPKDDYRTLYANLGERLVKSGDKVKSGQVIGTVGRNSSDEPPFLGFDMGKGPVGGVFINPLAYLNSEDHYDNPRIKMDINSLVGNRREDSEQNAGTPPSQPPMEFFSEEGFKLQRVMDMFNLENPIPTGWKIFYSNHGQTIKYSSEFLKYDGVTLEITPEIREENVVSLIIMMWRKNRLILDTELIVHQKRTVVLARPFPGENKMVCLFIKAEEEQIPSLASIPVEPDENTGPPLRTAYDERGKLISKVAHEYPDSARDNGIEGVVFLHLWIDKEGNVRKAVYISGPQALEAAARKAALQFKYTPAKREGQPVHFWDVAHFSFQLEDKSNPK